MNENDFIGKIKTYGTFKSVDPLIPVTTTDQVFDNEGHDLDTVIRNVRSELNNMSGQQNSWVQIYSESELTSDPNVISYIVET